ncbi:hypothetical protein EC2788150_5514 [Escherichia coli 2788150]|nr:hypothetical protein EC2788150_5514 [Escherichia coli 2788150]
MLFQPRDQLTLCQRFRRRFSRFVVQVTGLWIMSWPFSCSLTCSARS